MNVVGEFNNLIQVELVFSYQERFKELRFMMFQINLNFFGRYFISSFISVSNVELRPIDKMLKLSTLSLAIDQPM